MISAGSRLRDTPVGQNQGASLPGAAGLRYGNSGVSEELRQLIAGHASKAMNESYTQTDLKTLRRRWRRFHPPLQTELILQKAREPAANPGHRAERKQKT